MKNLTVILGIMIACCAFTSACFAADGGAFTPDKRGCIVAADGGALTDEDAGKNRQIQADGGA